MRRLLALACILLSIAGCDDNKKVCLPPGAAPSDAAVTASSIPHNGPDHFVIILDRSWGMAGFLRPRPNTPPARPTDNAFAAVVGGLSRLGKPFTTYTLPADPPPPTPQERDLAKLIEPVPCSNDLDRCKDFDTNAYINKFFDRALGGTTQMNLNLNRDSHDMVILVTDLQPDIPAAQGKDRGRQVYIQETFRKIVEAGLAVGVVPAVGRFYGRVYDTEATEATPGQRPEPLLDAPADRQPFFLIAVGRDDDVRAMLPRLRQVRDEGAADSNSFEPVLFSDQPPTIVATPFELAPTTEMPIEKTAPPPSDNDAFAHAARDVLALHRDRDQTHDVTLSYHPVSLSNDTTLPNYRVRIWSALSQARVWSYLGGSYAPSDCASRWTRVDSRGVIDIANTASPAGGDAISVTLHHAAMPNLLIGSLIYVEQDVTVAASAGQSRTPDWVAKWTFSPGTTWVAWRAHARDRPAGVSIGVNSLETLFQQMVARSQPAPTVRTLRFAIQINQN